MNGEVRQEKFGRPKKSSWRWPTGVLTTSRAVAGFRGCWHGNMSWPVAGKGFSYQVCLGCGAKRSFDESTFSAFGPFRYD